jgi:hypothetical protein
MAKFLDIGRNPDCPLCGATPRITDLSLADTLACGDSQCRTETDSRT